MKLTMPFPPSANDYWRSMVLAKPGQKPRAVVYQSAEAKEYKRVVKAMHADETPFRGPVKITATVYRPRRAGDLMNREKVLCDALEGIAYQNDSQIVEAHFFLADSKANPRVEIEVEEIKGELF